MGEWRVLIVEDDVAVAGVHARYLSKRARFRVVGLARTGAEARSLVDIHRPDLILLDLGLPGGDGVSLLRQLRTSGCPAEVVIISAHSRPEVVRAALQLGVVDYLVKPFWPERLAQALDTYELRVHELSEPLLGQDAVDRVRRGADDAAHGPGEAKRQRLAEVEELLVRHSDGLSAEQLAGLAGISRVTARRYLEDLVELGRAAVEDVADGPGRPHKHYRPRLSTRVGAAGGPAGR